MAMDNNAKDDDDDSSTSSSHSNDADIHSDNELAYPDESALQQFLRLRRERWKIRLGSMKINRRLVNTTFQAWAKYQDYEPKFTQEELLAQRQKIHDEKELNRKAFQLPKPYYGQNSVHSDYSIEPQDQQWKTLRWTDLLTQKYSLPSVYATADPLPFQLPPSRNNCFKIIIDNGHATYLRQMLQYVEETPETLDPLIVSYGITSGWPTIIKVFLEFGVDPNSIAIMPYTRSLAKTNKSTEKNTHLHRAAHTNDVECIKLLIQYGAAVDPKNVLGRTPLHLSCSSIPEANFMRMGNSKVHPAEVLLHYGANPNSSDVNHHRPLHHACLARDSTAIRLLIKHNADVLCEAQNFKLPYELIALKISDTMKRENQRSKDKEMKANAKVKASHKQNQNQNQLQLPKTKTKHKHALPTHTHHFDRRGEQALLDLKMALETDGRGSDFGAMYAKRNARQVFRRILSSFTTICPICRRRQTTCDHNKRTKYAYWNCTHKYIPRDCNVEKSARKSGLRTYTDPIPPKFSAPWNGPLYDSPNIVDQIERRKLPPMAKIGMGTPMEKSMFDNAIDPMGNLPWQTMLSPQQVARRKTTIALSLKDKEEKPWHRLTFAERKIELKKQALLKAQMKEVSRKFDESDESSSSSNDGSDGEDNDGDSDDEFNENGGPGGSGGKRSKSKSSKKRKQSILTPLRNPYERHRKGGDSPGSGKKKLPVQRRKQRVSNSWEEGENYVPDKNAGRKSRQSRDFKGRSSRASQGFRQSGKDMFITEEQVSEIYFFNFPRSSVHLPLTPSLLDQP
mgnify:CR=1 FL=1